MDTMAKELQADIIGYENRLSHAVAKLKLLPDFGYGWKQESELDRQRRRLLADISHVETLLRYCEEAEAGLEYV